MTSTICFKFPGVGQNSAAGARLRGHVLGDRQGVVPACRGRAVATPRAGHKEQAHNPRRKQDRPRQIQIRLGSRYT